MFCLAERLKALGGEWGARARTDGAAGTIVWFHLRFPPPPVVPPVRRGPGSIGGGANGALLTNGSVHRGSTAQLASMEVLQALRQAQAAPATPRDPVAASTGTGTGAGASDVVASPLLRGSAANGSQRGSVKSAISSGSLPRRGSAGVNNAALAAVASAAAAAEAAASDDVSGGPGASPGPTTTLAVPGGVQTNFESLRRVVRMRNQASVDISLRTAASERPPSGEERQASTSSSAQGGGRPLMLTASTQSNQPTQGPPLVRVWPAWEHLSSPRSQNLKALSPSLSARCVVDE